MRKIFLAIIALAFLGNAATAQIKKGSIFLGGDFGGSTQKTTSGDITTNKQKGIFFSPVFGKAIKDNLVLGINAGFSIYDNDYPYGGSTNFKTSGYNTGVFLRRYKGVGVSGFYLFLHAGLSAGYLTQKQEGPYSPDFDELKRTTLGVNAYPGLSYNISKKFHLETGFNNLLMLNYFHDKRETRNPGSISKTNGFNLSSSLNNATSSLYLGFRLLIAK